MIAEYSFLVLPQITLTFCPDFIGDGSITAERRTSEYFPRLQHTLASLLSMFVDCNDKQISLSFYSKQQIICVFMLISINFHTYTYCW